MGVRTGRPVPPKGHEWRFPPQRRRKQTGAFGWAFATRVGTRWRRGGLTVWRRPDARPTFLGDEVGALSLEQYAQQDDLAAQATALLETNAAVSDRRETRLKITPGRPARTRTREDS